MALTCITSYCMTIFDSVPLVLITGEKGTGKSEFSRALIDVSANAKMIGQGSAAAIARAIDSTRGLAVLDDQDQLGGKLKNDAQSESLRQLLKQSYSKKSASKSVFDGSKDKTLNFYGIKVINNTTGIDTITGSRCLHIFTQPMPTSEQHQFMARNLNRLNDTELANLRDEIHSWVFSNVSSIHAMYRIVFKGTTNRTDEIHAPLRTFAALANNSEISHSLENGLKRQISIINSPDESIDDKLSNIVHSLIFQGYRFITPTHVYLELQFRIKNHVSATVHDSDTFSPEWVGRHLRAQNLIDPTYQDRKMVRGHKLRVLKLNSDVVESVLENQNPETSVEQEPSDATGFCQFKRLNTCSGCRYSGITCFLRGRH